MRTAWIRKVKAALRPRKKPPSHRRKKRKISPNDVLPRFNEDFDIVGCDLSYTCPGFALLRYHADTGSVELLRKDIVPNKTKTKKKKHGEIINEIGTMFRSYIVPVNVRVAARERGFVQFNYSTAMLYRVQGAIDMILWDRKQQVFQEYSPMTIKLCVAGSGSATKQDVADAIENYCEHTPFKTDDESDAVAVALTWLIENGYLESRPLAKYEETFRKKMAEAEEEE